MQEPITLKKKSINTTKLYLCSYCFNFYKEKLIKCNDCGQEYCLKCLTEINKNPNLLLCNECLAKFVKEKAILIISDD